MPEHDLSWLDEVSTVVVPSPEVVTAAKPQDDLSWLDEMSDVVVPSPYQQQAPPSAARQAGRAVGEYSMGAGRFLRPDEEGTRSTPAEMYSGALAAAPRMVEGIGQYAQMPYHARRLQLKHGALGMAASLIPGADKYIPEIPDITDLPGALFAAVEKLTGFRSPADKLRAAAGKQLEEFAGGWMESEPVKPGKDIEEGKAPWKRRARSLGEGVGQVVEQIGLAMATGGSSSLATLPMALQEAGAGYNRNLQRLIEEKNPQTEEELRELQKQAGRAGIDQGVMTWITEKLGLDVLMHGVPAPLRKKVSDSLIKQAEKFTTKLSDRAKWWLLTLGDRVATGLVEGSQEVLQENLGAAIDYYDAGDEKAFDNIFERSWEAGGIGFIIGTAVSPTSGGGRKLDVRSDRIKKLNEFQRLRQKVYYNGEEASRKDAQLWREMTGRKPPSYQDGRTRFIRNAFHKVNVANAGLEAGHPIVPGIPPTFEEWQAQQAQEAQNVPPSTVRGTQEKVRQGESSEDLRRQGQVEGVTQQAGEVAPAQEEVAPPPAPAAAPETNLKDAETPREFLDLLVAWHPDLGPRYEADAGVSEGYTVGEHTERTLARWADQPSGEMTERQQQLLRLTVALHDIGKGEAVAAKDKGRQHEFTLPVLRQVLELEGFTENEMALAEALVDQDIIGGMLRGKMSPMTATKKITAQAEKAGVDPKDFLKTATAFYKSDAGAYPKVEQEVMPEGIITDERLGVLEEGIHGEALESPWIGRIRAATGKAGREGEGGGTGFVHATAYEIGEFNPDKDSGKNRVGPGVYLLTSEDADVAEHYARRALKRVKGLFSAKTRERIDAVSTREEFDSLIEIAKRKQSSDPKNAERWADAAIVLRGLRDGIIGEHILTVEVDIPPESILDLGSEATGRILTEDERTRIADAVGVKALGLPKRGMAFYNALAKKVGYARLNKALESIGYKGISFLHRKGGYKRRYAVLNVLNPADANILQKPPQAPEQPVQPSKPPEAPAPAPAPEVAPAAPQPAPAQPAPAPAPEPGTQPEATQAATEGAEPTPATETAPKAPAAEGVGPAAEAAEAVAEARQPITLHDIWETGHPEWAKDYEKAIGDTHKLLIDSDAFAESDFYDRTQPIPKVGGIIAARQSAKYAQDPEYRNWVDGRIDDITKYIVDLNRKRMILSGVDISGEFGVSYSIQPEKRTAGYTVDVVRAWHMEAKSKYPYTSHLGDVAIREALQNSLDAVLAAREANRKHQGTIDFQVEREGFTIRDNGIGMSEDDIAERFLALHATGKDKPGRFGGFGIAKAVILGPSDTSTWVLKTRDNLFTHELAQQRQAIQTLTEPIQGTEIEVRDTAGNGITSGLAKLYVETTETPKAIKLTFNGEAVKNPFRQKRSTKESISLDNAAGTLDVAYYSKAPEGLDKMLVLRLVDPQTGAKLTQGIMNVYNEGFRGTIVADITTTQTPGDNYYPLTDSRMELKWNSKKLIDEIIEKHSVDPLSAKRAGQKSRTVPLSSHRAWKKTVDKATTDPEYQNVVKVIREIYEETQQYFGTSPVPFTPLSDLTLKIDVGFKGYAGGSIFHAKHLAAYEAVARLYSSATGARVSHFYGLLSKPIDGGSVASEYGGGSLGLNYLVIAKEAIKNPLEYSLYLRDLINHELTHETYSKHDEAFSSARERTGQQTAHLQALTLRIAEAVIGKPSAITKVVEVPVKGDTVIKELLPEKQLELFAEEERGYVDAKVELYLPESKERESEPRLFGPRSTSRAGNVPSEAVGIRDRGGTKLTDIPSDVEGSTRRVQPVAGVSRGSQSVTPGTKPTQTVPTTPSAGPAQGGVSGVASKPSERADIEPKTGTATGALLQPIQMPELFQLAKDLMEGKIPRVKKLRGAAGRFKGAEGLGPLAVLIDPTTAADEQALAQTLAHEIGHLVDFLPDYTLKRGNLLGRLQSLRDFLKSTIPPLDKKDMARIRRQAKKEAGKEATKDEVGAVYQRMLKQRGLLANKAIRDELIALTKWWSGDYTGGKTSYVKYRESSRELYAEALSVFLNSPGDLETRAPTFYQAVLDNLDSKPDVLQAYSTLQQMLNGTGQDLAESRTQTLRDMFGRAEEHINNLRIAQKQRRKSVWSGITDFLGQYFLTSAQPVFTKLGRKPIKRAESTEAEAARFALDELFTIDSPNHTFLRGLDEQVYQPLIEAMQDRGLSREQAEAEADFTLGEYLYHWRVANERDAIANPAGFTATPSTAQLEAIKARIGDDAYTKLQEYAQRFHDLVYASAEEAANEGVYNREIFDTVITPNKENYAAFRVTHYIDDPDVIATGVIKQVGTFSDIQNPFHSTVLKVVRLNRLIELNRAKNRVRQFLEKNFPDDITPVEMVFAGEGRPRIPRKQPGKGKEHLVELVDGHPVYFEVPTEIAKSFSMHDIGGLGRIAAVVNSATYKVFHPFFVTYNPGFVLANPFRDLRRTWVNIGATDNVSLGKLLYEWAKALPVAVRRQKGIEDAVIQDMIDSHALDIPYTDVAAEGIESQIDQLFQKYGLKTKQKRTLEKIPVIGRILELIEHAGAVTETATKVAGWRVLEAKGVPVQERSYRVRKYVGTPDYKQRGLATALTNSMMMYSRVRWNGLQADISLATNPDTAAGWWWRQLLNVVLPTSIAKAAAYGAFGLALRAMFGVDDEDDESAPGKAASWTDETGKRIAKYFLTDYDVIPLGVNRDGKAVFITIPRDDLGKFIARTWWHVTDLAQLAAGQRLRKGETVRDVAGNEFTDIKEELIPSFSPPIEITSKWLQYGAGVNPVDSFYNQQIIPHKEWTAGGWAADSKMMAWTLDEFGAPGALIHYPLSPLLGETFEAGTSGGVEAVMKTAGAMTGLKRLIRVSDSGLTSDQWALLENADQEATAFRLSLPNSAQDASTRRYFLMKREALGDALSEQEQNEMHALNLFYNAAYVPLRKMIQEAEEAGSSSKQFRADMKQAADSPTALWKESPESIADTVASYKQGVVLSAVASPPDPKKYTSSVYQEKLAKYKQALVASQARLKFFGPSYTDAQRLLLDYTRKQAAAEYPAGSQKHKAALKYGERAGNKWDANLDASYKAKAKALAELYGEKDPISGWYTANKRKTTSE